MSFLETLKDEAAAAKSRNDRYEQIRKAQQHLKKQQVLPRMQEIYLYLSRLATQLNEYVQPITASCKVRGCEELTDLQHRNYEVVQDFNGDKPTFLKSTFRGIQRFPDNLWNSKRLSVIDVPRQNKVVKHKEENNQAKTNNKELPADCT